VGKGLLFLEVHKVEGVEGVLHGDIFNSDYKEAAGLVIISLADAHERDLLLQEESTAALLLRAASPQR
jgi:hypothetical protein